MQTTAKCVLLALFFALVETTAQPPARQITLQYGNAVWLGTELGLIRYQPDNEQWSSVLPDPTTDICLDEDMVWVGTRQGIQYADIRYLDWKKYTTANGLGSDTIIRIAADLDYIYAAGPHSVSRFNKLVGQWESLGDFSAKRIYDLYSDQNFLWVATDNGIFYFEKQFEKWKQYVKANGLVSDSIRQIFYFKENLWIRTDNGFSKFNAAMKTWSSYALSTDIPAAAVRTVRIDADNIWLLTPEGVVRYNGKNQAWEHFSKNTMLEKVTVSDGASTGKVVWFTTSDGVTSYADDTKKWTTYTAIEGLSDDVQDEVYCIGQTIVCKKGNTFSTYAAGEDLFRSKTLATGGARGQNKSWEWYDDQRGAGFKTPSGASASLLGTAYFKLKNKADFPEPFGKSISNYIKNKNLDSIVPDTTIQINSQNPNDTDTVITEIKIPRYKDYMDWWLKSQLTGNIDLTKGRSIRLIYDNTDPLKNFKYGGEYRGNEDDHVRKAGYLSHQKTDYYFSSLIDQTYMEGIAMRTEFGRRIGDKKRRRVNNGLWAGWRKTSYMKKLIPFQEDNFYYLNVNNITTESVQIRVDGKLIDPRDYSIERTMGILTFKNENLVNPDTRIEISGEYEPVIGAHTSEMAAMENMVVLNDRCAVGVNGLYRGIQEPDRPGTGRDTNRLFTGSINSEIDLKSKSGKASLKAVPEISSSYNDSILVKKQGTAGKLGLNASLYDFTLKGSGQLFTPNYESITDMNSIYGRMHYLSDASLTYDITEYMPLTASAGYVNAAAGRENRQSLEYVAAPANKPSLRLGTLHQEIYSLAKRNPLYLGDSIKTTRWNGSIESVWDLPERALSAMRINRLWLDVSYSLDFTADSLFDSTLTDTAGTTDFLQHVNHNLFGWLRFSPVKSITLETKQIYRYFQVREEPYTTWRKNSERYKPEFILFSQEFIPGITTYAKYTIDRVTDIADPYNTEEPGSLLNQRLTSSLLLIPGVWFKFLNPLQINLGYSFLRLDTLNNDKILQVVIDQANQIDTSYLKKRLLNFGHTFTLNPILDFNQIVRITDRSDFSIQKDTCGMKNTTIKSYNDVECMLADRKTRLLFEYDYTQKEDLLRNGITKKDTLDIINYRHEPRFKWTQYWQPLFRTELPIAITWQKADSLYPQKDSRITHDYSNSLSSGILFDRRIQKQFIREFRVQYYIGGTLYDGTFFTVNSYKTAWDNKFDISLRAGKNLTIRMLLNLSYRITEKLLKYDLAELKAQAVF